LAAELAARTAPQDRSTYWLDSLEIGVDVAAILKQCGASLRDFTPATSRENCLAEVSKGAIQFLESSQRDPVLFSREFARRALHTLAKAHNIVHLPEGTNEALPLLKKWEFLFSEPDQQDKLVDILLLEVSYGEGEAAITRAEQIAQSIPAGTQHEAAMARCLLARAEFRKANLDKKVAEAADRNAAKKASTKTDRVKADYDEVTQLFMEAEQHLARAKGEDVLANLEKLRQQQLVTLPNRFEQSFASNLEMHRLREFVEATTKLRQDGALCTLRWLQLAGFEGELDASKRNVKLPAQAQPIFRALHDFLKPAQVSRERPLSPDDKVLVELLEQRLAL
jgi:hypothetical protein